LLSQLRTFVPFPALRSIVVPTIMTHIWLRQATRRSSPPWPSSSTQAPVQYRDPSVSFGRLQGNTAPERRIESRLPSWVYCPFSAITTVTRQQGFRPLSRPPPGFLNLSTSHVSIACGFVPPRRHSEGLTFRVLPRIEGCPFRGPCSSVVIGLSRVPSLGAPGPSIAHRPCSLTWQDLRTP
jgi:hypothetical protein